MEPKAGIEPYQQQIANRMPTFYLRGDQRNALAECAKGGVYRNSWNYLTP